MVPGLAGQSGPLATSHVGPEPSHVLDHVTTLRRRITGLIARDLKMNQWNVLKSHVQVNDDDGRCLKVCTFG